MAKPVNNSGASVRARLLNLAQSSGQPFDILLVRFVLERLLYRLGASQHANRFVLKGATQAPSEYFKANIFITTSGTFSHDVLRCCVDILGAGRILFAIDYPYERSDEAMQFLRTADLSRADAERIAYRNAQQLFGIKNSAFPQP